MNIATIPTINARPATPIAAPMPALAPVLRPLVLEVSSEESCVLGEEVEEAEPAIADV